MSENKAALEEVNHAASHEADGAIRGDESELILSKETVDTIRKALTEADGLREKLRRIEDDDTALEKILAMTDEQTRALYAERGECAECAATRSKATMQNALSYFHQRSAELELEKVKAQLEANAIHIGDLLDVNEENARLRGEIVRLERSRMDREVLAFNLVTQLSGELDRLGKTEYSNYWINVHKKNIEDLGDAVTREDTGTDSLLTSPAKIDDVEFSAEVANKYWIMGTGIYRPFFPPTKPSEAEMICKCETVEQAHAIRKEIIRAARAVQEITINDLVNTLMLSRDTQRELRLIADKYPDGLRIVKEKS